MKSPAMRGFLVSAEEVGQIKDPVRSTRVRLLGRTAQEDVDAGDARRARDRYVPSQSLPLWLNAAMRGIFVSAKEAGQIKEHCAKHTGSIILAFNPKELQRRSS